MFFNPVDNRGLYNIVNSAKRSMQPFSDYSLEIAKQYANLGESMHLPLNNTIWLETPKYYLKLMAGLSYFSHLVTRPDVKPKFDIQEIKINDKYIDVIEKIVVRKSFCKLIRFKKVMETEQPKLLLVAPMSGHYATLLRDTVRDLLPFYDVYITDWKNARDVPLSEGSFDLEEFALYITSFLHYLGKGVHVMAVCQATIPVLMALAVMSTNEDPFLPNTAILLGGPIDTDQGQTVVNELATTRSNDWFKQNVISIVPSGYPGYMRLVCPGFMQLLGFMSMHPERHLKSFVDSLHHYAQGDSEKALKTANFYNEFFSTMDLTAEFYMQTINTVFQQKLLTKGRLKSHGKDVLLKDISHTAILAIEGELDDITGVGQTKSVLDLCQNLPDAKKKYFLAKEVGHYGLFNGSQFRKLIIPAIREFTEGF